MHGGYGYTREYDVEQFYRDNRLNPIHEGTHGIHGLDLLGRKAVMKDGAALRLLLGRVEDTARRATSAGGDAATYATSLREAATRLGTVTARLWQDGDPRTALANASVYLEAAGHVVLAWIWLEQLLAAGAGEGSFYAGKRAAARYFFRYELPRTAPQFALLESLDTTAADMEPDWF
ncbi:butyryl-CoA dehydrogenase [Streptomyces sp. SolWspMP-sol7th]|nr:acyl-CoA dehydrogenase C-terminal domain-containing protein [Streptomyces sp. SolWspMP-sol7th]SCD83504.1 butyryl-CoA dehydrogenase [Streptomyces sp. SolWspMP-sol7th]